VAILPYIDQKALYDQYNFNEPWDSEANRRVLEKMPVLFQSPGDGPRSRNTSYFVLTGTGSMFGASKAPTFPDITDGLSNTIMIVEAKREVPWTKPEDIEYDPKQPLPKFGGFFPGGFNAGFGDGSVRFIQDKVDEQALRALITSAGGEVVTQDDPSAPNVPRRTPPTLRQR
jgi:prepilin-type processing-associated H-X9-DG protein